MEFTILGWLLPIFLAVLAWAIMVHGEWREKRAHTRADIAYRAENQHAAIMDGDDLYGIYGYYPPADL